MCTEAGSARSARQHGASLIEVVVFIVVVSVAAAAVLGSLQFSARASADPLLRMQALAIAEAMIEEIILQPITWCDPQDARAATAASAAQCAALPESSGPEAGESRYSRASPFDNVNDYDGFAMSGIRDPANRPIPGLEAYAVAVTVRPATLADEHGRSAPALRVSVTVTGPADTRVVLESFRTGHSPNAVD